MQESMQESKQEQPIDGLVFVYNADSGLVNLLKDIGHKLLSPKTYPCSLCDLTFSVLGERKSWVRFRKTLPVPQQYLHIDEFEKVFPDADAVQYPVVFTLRAGTLTQVVTREQLDNCQSLAELKSLVLSLLT